MIKPLFKTRIRIAYFFLTIYIKKFVRELMQWVKSLFIRGGCNNCGNFNNNCYGRVEVAVCGKRCKNWRAE